MITMTRPPAQPWPAHIQPASAAYPYPQPAPPTTPKRRSRWIIPTAAGLALLAIVMVAAGGFITGRNTAPSITTQVTTTVTAEPQHESFTAADSAWCREYMATTARLVEAGRTADAPRSIAASDLPATAWTPEEADTNRKLAEWSNRWDVERERLRNGVENPTLRLLLTGSLTASTELTTKIADGTYKPVDFALFRSVTATDNALSSICDRI